MEEKIRKILIWRNGKLGNTLVMLPFLQVLREVWPNITIDVIVDALGAELLKYHPAINRLIIYDKRGKDKSIAATILFVLLLRKQKYTHSVHIKRFFRNEFLALLAGIPNRFGFRSNGKMGLLTAAVNYSEEVNIVRTVFALGKFFNFNVSEPPRYRYYTSKEDAIEVEEILDSLNLGSFPFVIIHCGGETSTANKVPYSFYASLITQLRLQGRQPVLLEPPGEQKHVQEVLACLPNDDMVRICKVGPIRANALIISKASLFIGNNSGQVHLAALYSIPSVVVYGSDKQLASHSIQKWLPWQMRIGYHIYSADKNDSMQVGEILEKCKLL